MSKPYVMGPVVTPAAVAAASSSSSFPPAIAKYTPPLRVVFRVELSQGRSADCGVDLAVIQQLHPSFQVPWPGIIRLPGIFPDAASFPRLVQMLQVAYERYLCRNSRSWTRKQVWESAKGFRWAADGPLIRAIMKAWGIDNNRPLFDAVIELGITGGERPPLGEGEEEESKVEEKKDEKKPRRKRKAKAKEEEVEEDHAQKRKRSSSSTSAAAATNSLVPATISMQTILRSSNEAMANIMQYCQRLDQEMQAMRQPMPQAVSAAANKASH